MSERMTAERLEQVRSCARTVKVFRAAGTRVTPIEAALIDVVAELDAVRAERDGLSEVVTGLRAELKHLTRERDEARKALETMLGYVDELLAVTDSPGTRQTLLTHLNIARRALTPEAER